MPATEGTEEYSNTLRSVLGLYEQGRYTDALAAGACLGDIRHWPGTEGRILAGRLAGNLGAPRLGRALHWLAGRQFPQDAQALYYGAMAYWNRFGTIPAWLKYRMVDLSDDVDPSLRADWSAMKALMVAMLRDFSRAEQLMIVALDLDPHSAWLHVELSEVLDRQDLHEESLRAAQDALALRPFFRPAVQSAAHRLVQLRRDDEAMQLLMDATERLQSGEVWCQLAALQMELKDYESARHSLNEAEKYWPLARADSQHLQWLAGERCDVAYYLGRYDEAIALAEGIKRPFYERLRERLKRAIPQALTAHRPPRIQLSVPFVRQFHDTCAPATLTSIAQYWQKAIKHEEIVERICYEGTRAYDERRWAEENGFIAREFRVTETCVEGLIRAGIPMTLNTVDPGSAHLQGIVGFDIYRGTFLVQDPGERHVGEAATDKFLEHYASTGPRGMILLPSHEMARLAGIELPDAELYDLQYLADVALARFERQAAQDAIDQLVQLAPNHRLTLQCQLSLARYDANPTEQAKLVDRLLEQFPTDANLLMMKCGLLCEFGQRTERIALLTAACKGEKTHPIFWSRLAAELLDDARDHEEARRQLRRALRYHQGDGRALSLLADYYWIHRQRTEALELYRLAASLSEKDETQARRYFEAARYLHETEAVLDWLRDRYDRFSSRSSSSGRTLASVLENLDRTVDAQKIIKETIAKHSDDGELLCVAAMLFGRYNQPETAGEYLRMAEGKCSQAAFVRTSAQLALYQRRLAEARELFLRVIELNPLDMDARERLIGLDLDLDGVEVCEHRLRRAVADFPHSYSLRVMLIQWLRSYKLKDADEELNRFLEFHPQDAWARREATIAALIAHDLKRAAAEVAIALELEPNSEVSHFLQGRVYLQLGAIADARAAFRRAIEHNVDHDSAISSLLETCDRPSERAEQLAFVYGQLRKQTTYGDGVCSYRDAAAGHIAPETLLSQLEEARSHRPDLWQTWSMVVQQHSAMNQRKKAIEVARESAERFPLLPRVWLDLALAFRNDNDHDAELKALESARAINPHWPDVARELSELYMNRQQYDDAERVIRQVLSADPRDATSLAALGDCLYRAGKKEAALEPLVSACSSAPGYDWAWSRLTEWSHEIDEGRSAQAAAQKAITDRPHDARCYGRMAEALRKIEDVPRALEYIETGLELDRRFIDLHVHKAYCLGRLHRWDEALDACNPPILQGDIPVALRMRRAYVLYRKGQLPAAIDEMQGALQRDPDHYGAWNQLADWAEESGRRDVYKQAAENMVRLDPHQPAPRGYLADALLSEESGRVEGKKHLRIALEFSPDYSYGAMRLFDLHVEDAELDQAGQVLDLGGQHLPPGFEQSLKTQLLAAQDAIRTPVGNACIPYLLEWTSQPQVERPPLMRAMDRMDDRIARQAIEQLREQIIKNPQLEAAGTALGRLLGRLSSTPDCLQTLRLLPDGEAWQCAVRTLLRSMAGFRKENALLQAIVAKHKKRLTNKTETWAAVASTLLDFGQNVQVVRWTQDCLNRSDATPLQLVSAVASRWENFQIASARPIIEQGLKKQEDDGTPLLHVWAGLDALLSGNDSAALEHARQVGMHQLGQWYIVGYRILVTSIEAMPELLAGQAKSEHTIIQAKVDALHPKAFQLEPQYARDPLTKWILYRVAARIARSHGLTLSWITNTAKSWTCYWLKNS